MKTEIDKKLSRLAWLIWVTTMVALCLSLFHRLAGATIADRLMAEFNLSATAVGTLLAMFFYVYGVLQFPVGTLADSLGPRKIVSFGCLIASIGAVVFGLAPSLPVLYIGRFLVSVGVSVAFVSVLKIAAVWFHSRSFGFMAALLVVVSAGGALAATTPLALLVTWVGWRASFQLIGLLSLGIAIGCWLIIRDRPQDLGLPSPAELDRQESGGNLAQPVGLGITFGQRVRLVFANPYTWPPFIMAAGLYGTLLVFVGAWGIPYLMQVYNMARSTAANYMLLATVGMVVGAPIVTHVSDRLVQRRKVPAIICISAYLSLWLILTFWNAGRLSPLALGTICFLMGFFTSYQGLIFACIKEVTPPFVSGMAIGVVNIGVFVSPAILQPLFGRILDLGWQGAVIEGARVYPVEAYHSAFLLVCGAVALGVTGAFFAKETRCRDLAR